MSKPVFSDPFTLSGRRNRKSYILYWLACAVAVAVLWFVVIAATAVVGGPHGPAGGAVRGAGLVVIILVHLPIAISLWIVGAQRCRDFGWTGWGILIALIPFIGWIFSIALWFIPGNVGPNRYGPDPLAEAGPLTASGQAVT